jgi:hypothetical protein
MGRGHENREHSYNWLSEQLVEEAQLLQLGFHMRIIGKANLSDTEGKELFGKAGATACPPPSASRSLHRAGGPHAFGPGPEARC